MATAVLVWTKAPLQFPYPRAVSKIHPRNSSVAPPISCFSTSGPRPDSAGMNTEAAAGEKMRQNQQSLGLLDNLFLHLFRAKMVRETGWESEKPGYDGLIEVANHLTIGRSNSETIQASVRILRSLFPPLLLELYRILVAPLAQGKVAAAMIARVTALSCKWLMGQCQVNSVPLPDGSSLMSGVFVERCKYLEESKCVGVCINTCKLPTQTFFHDYMGVPLLMEPNFTDYSCQTCPHASRRGRAAFSPDHKPNCPKA
ncbi:beta-carotene isomerase D27, chloroplastic isoform X2 [Coffea eugenioides]|uniref:beta-carotene isomerase D27, chloroplastic isoform X2 n=1 Tax=Coffea eugenioides TaxID=49369 RepID=UPI000F60E325|nr:beta-carotene isomerase D27, chloroplastic isoform X2 [Coffea eugenioides]